MMLQALSRRRAHGLCMVPLTLGLTSTLAVCVRMAFLAISLVIADLRHVRPEHLSVLLPPLLGILLVIGLAVVQT